MNMNSRQWFGSTIYYDGEITLVVFADGTGIFSTREKEWKSGKFVPIRKTSRKDTKGIQRTMNILGIGEEVWS